MLAILSIVRIYSDDFFRTKPAIYSMGREDADECLLVPGVENGTYMFRTSKTFGASIDAAALRGSF